MIKICSVEKCERVKEYSNYKSSYINKVLKVPFVAGSTLNAMGKSGTTLCKMYYIMLVTSGRIRIEITFVKIKISSEMLIIILTDEF
jgi:hypothetical protein